MPSNAAIDAAVRGDAIRMWNHNLENVQSWGPKCYESIVATPDCYKIKLVNECLHGHVQACRDAKHMQIPDVCNTHEIVSACTPPAPKYHNGGNFLAPHDFVGTTFYIACNMMLAFTLFFFVQVGQVPKKWKTSVSVAGLVTGVAWYNYTFMKTQWVATGSSPTPYRYTDWLITVPLQIVEFYFILKASGPVNGSLGTRLFTSSILMVVFGWLSEICFLSKVVGFAGGMACWLYIVYETFSGEASQYAAKLTSSSSKSAYATLRLIVSVGWTMYPIGYAVCYIIPGLGFSPLKVGPNNRGPPYGLLNVVYNLADLVNKGAFGLCVWSAAVADKEE
jgi:bacteriorhodopsin